MKRFLAIFFVISFFSFSNAVIFAQNRPDALSEYRNGNWKSAAEVCRAEIKENTQNLEAHIVLCWSLLKLGLYSETETYALAAQKLNRYDVRVIEILGEVYYYLGQNYKALQYFQEYINLAPEGQRIDVVFYLEGEIYIRLSRFKHADIALSTALHYIPDNARWWARLGYARENAGEPREALIAYEKALALDAGLTDAKRGLDRVRNAL